MATDSAVRRACDECAVCRIAKVVRESPQVERFLHVSALGAAQDALSKRLRTKVGCRVGVCVWEYWPRSMQLGSY
jgi:hypothetical protein